MRMSRIQTRYEAQINDLVSACHRLAELGYVTSSGGNLSLRVDESTILITPTKTPKRFPSAPREASMGNPMRS